MGARPCRGAPPEKPHELPVGLDRPLGVPPNHPALVVAAVGPEVEAGLVRCHDHDRQGVRGGGILARGDLRAGAHEYVWLGQVHIGEPYLYRRLIPPWIINFPTKEHWRSVSRLSDIVAGLEYLERHYREWEVTSLAVPPLGCGEGGLEWRVVGRTLFAHLQRFDIPVELYAPYGTPPAELEETFLVHVARGSDETADTAPRPRITVGAVALVETLARIVREPHHWPVGRTIFQKLAYFATEAGLPTGLEYSKGSYGPFSSDLKPLITRLVNNGLIREERLGRMFAVRPGPTYEDARKAFLGDLKKWEPVIDRVADHPEISNNESS